MSTDLTKNDPGLISKVLGDPSQYPDEFKSWLPRWLNQNINLKLQLLQLPDIEKNNLVGETGSSAFENGWVNYGGSNEPALYYKDFMGRVHLGGIVKDGSSTIFTLPPRYRPQYALLFSVATNTAAGVGMCIVSPDGSVVMDNGDNAYFSLSGISFRAFS